MRSLILFLATCSFLTIFASSAGVSPIWSITSSIKTGTYDIVNSLFPAGGTNQYTIGFSGPFSTSVTPMVVYGIQRYRGIHLFIQAVTICFRNHLSSAFRVQIL